MISPVAHPQRGGGSGRSARLRRLLRWHRRQFVRSRDGRYVRAFTGRVFVTSAAVPVLRWSVPGDPRVFPATG